MLYKQLFSNLRIRTCFLLALCVPAANLHCIFGLFKKPVAVTPAASAPAAVNSGAPAATAATISQAATTTTPTPAIKVAPKKEFFGTAAKLLLAEKGQENVTQLLQEASNTLTQAKHALTRLEPVVQQLPSIVDRANVVLKDVQPATNNLHSISSNIQTIVPMVAIIGIPVLLLVGLFFMQKIFASEKKKQKEHQTAQLNERLEQILMSLPTNSAAAVAKAT